MATTDRTPDRENNTALIKKLLHLAMHMDTPQFRNVPMYKCDIDAWITYRGFPSQVSCLFELKEGETENYRRPWMTETHSMKALCDLATNRQRPIPFVVIQYFSWKEPWEYRVFCMNRRAYQFFTHQKIYTEAELLTIFKRLQQKGQAA